MTGYLQRLVASAMKPEPRIHPVLAPVFSASNYAADDSGFVQEEEAAVPRSPSQEAVPPVPAMESASIDAVPTMRPRQQESLEPATTQVVAQQAEVRDPDRASLTPASAVMKGLPAARRYTRYVPLLPAAPAAPADESDFPTISPSQEPVAQQRRDKEDRGAAASTAQSSAPDEIQITIGRIEVAALPETRARPAAKARHKPSLDDYLRRADARRR